MNDFIPIETRPEDKQHCMVKLADGSIRDMVYYEDGDNTTPITVDDIAVVEWAPVND